MVLVAAAVVTADVVAVGVVVLTRRSEPAPVAVAPPSTLAPSPGSDPTTTTPSADLGDTFDRPDGDGLGEGPPGYEWRGDSGTWAVRGGRATATGHDGFATFATVDTGEPDGTAEVRVVRLRDGAGLVFRYVDPENFWAVAAVPEFGTWHLLRVVDGAGSDAPLAVIPAPTTDQTRIGVRAVGERIEVLVDGEPVEERSDGTHRDAMRWGIMMKGPETTAARFDDFRFERAG